ncbi:MAG: hypothetical protein K8R69_09255 [Deltaproteobacteria bacterium]|nr:hypothetical protein [Deltaproteobacteria bacterium]
MFALLADMFKRGNPIDVIWFLAGAWLLVAFFVMLITQIVRRLRGKGPKDPQDRFQ